MKEEEMKEEESTENAIVVRICKLDKSDCDHEFTQTGDPNQDYCTKCGQSVWAWAFMEMP